MGQTLINGVMVGDRFNGNYGAFGNSPFVMGPVQQSWQHGVPTAQIDIYMTFDGVRRTMELLGREWNYPIAETQQDFYRLKSEGKTFYVSSGGGENSPGIWRIYYPDGRQSDVNGMAQDIITWGVNETLRMYGANQTQTQNPSLNNNTYVGDGRETTFTAGNAGGTVTQQVQTPVNTEGQSYAGGNTGSQTQVQTVTTTSGGGEGKGFMDHTVKIGEFDVPIVVLGVAGIAAFFAFQK